ncbi:OadG family protein [Thermodesulfobacteriota bacterium]
MTIVFSEWAFLYRSEVVLAIVRRCPLLGRNPIRGCVYMEAQTNWSEVFGIVITGFGAVFVIMVLLALITSLVGKLVQKVEKPKETK